VDEQPTEEIKDRVAGLLRERPQSWRRVQGGGYTPAQRWFAELSGKRVFVKVAPTKLTQSMMRREFAIYDSLSTDFMPRALGWQDDEHAPLLILEDLSSAFWPPPWTNARIDAALHTIERLHATPPPPNTPSAELRFATQSPNWPFVEKNPALFLGLGLVSEAWLQGALPTLLAAEAQCDYRGETLCHFDIRSDNICFLPDGRAVLIDWAEACLGNPDVDLGAWLPSLALEDGPLPDDILPNRPEVAAWICGFFAARAGLPIIPDAPRVREIQFKQLITALPWMIRALGLPPPSGASSS
jgi:hypothetical protein